jgi:predicted transcriptional regulator
MAKRELKIIGPGEKPAMAKIWPTIGRFLKIFDKIDEKSGKALKWDLIKLVGSEAAFKRLITNLLLKNRLLKEFKEGRRTYYSKTEDGELFHKTLRNDYLLKTWARIGKKKLRQWPFEREPPEW